MRRAVFVLSALALAGCVSNRLDHDGTIQTPAEANRDGLGGAVTAPLRDVNVVRTKIPEILLTAHADPYARPPEGCPALVAEVEALDEALGPDRDDPGTKVERGLLEKGRTAATNTALGMVASTAQDLIPMRGWVRKLTGAERHSRLVGAVITDGGLRRAYLKGLGESRGCDPPGTPRHLAKPPEVIEQERGPRYPIR